MNLRSLLVFTLAALGVAACATSPTSSSATSPFSARAPRTSGTGPRAFAVQVPSSYDPGRPAPLVLEIAGFMTEGHEQEEYFKLGKVAMQHGVLLALVTGSRNPDGYPYWNATDACCDFHGQRPDDVAYLDAVLDDLFARYNVDPKRVWLVGHSNGGFMAHRYACERAARVAAIASFAGGNWLEAGRCAPSEPLSVLQVHGDADKSIKFDGGSLADPELLRRWTSAGVKMPAAPRANPYPSARASLEPWRLRDGCDAAEQAAGQLDVDAKVEGAETSVSRWECRAGAVELWTVHGGGHNMALTASTPERIFAFLEAHPKP